jgi:4,5-DOPA dioxygenase extradiol
MLCATGFNPLGGGLRFNHGMDTHTAHPPAHHWAPLFLSHGSPMTALEPREAGDFWHRLGQQCLMGPRRPRAVLAISAHSLTREPVLLGAAQHEAVYDFGGFDEALYTLRYDAPSAPALAREVQAMLGAAGIAAHLLPEGGLDHGIWVPLRYLLPQADIPVLPLAWNPRATPAALMQLGAALSALADDGVLIIGSGSITHNLQRVFANGRVSADQPATAESLAFREWFVARGAALDWAALTAYRSQAPYGALMHPTDEHLLPWFVAAGAGGQADAALRIHASQTHGDLGMDAYAFGPWASMWDIDGLKAPA